VGEVTFQTREELEAWARLEARKASMNAAMMAEPADKIAVFKDSIELIRRVTLSHHPRSHTMSSNPIAPLDEAMHEIACLKAEVAALRRINASNAAARPDTGLAGAVHALVLKLRKTKQCDRTNGVCGVPNFGAELEAVAALCQPASDPGDVERVAVALWRNDAERAAPNVAKGRTLEAFAEQSEDTRLAWIGAAKAAIAALQVKP
jgi:hypothetical protein